MNISSVESSASLNDELSNGCADADLPLKLSLELIIDDRDIIRALVEYPEGEERNQYAMEALKIGVLALRHVGGRVGADLLRQEGDRFLANVQRTLDTHKQTIYEQLENKLKEYFDPKDGRFTDRVQRLVAQDGELSTLLKGYIDGENCVFSRTLMNHVGRESPLMRMLDPQQGRGAIASCAGVDHEPRRFGQGFANQVR